MGNARKSAPAGPSREPASVRRMFTAIAPRYDLANRVLSLGQDRWWRSVAARLLAPAAGERALDLACGTGDLSRALARGGGTVVGADFTHAMLRRARDRDGSVLWAAADALSLPFADASFDRVTVAFGVRNFARPERGLAEMHRVLRPGGRLGVLEFAPPSGPLAAPVRLWLTRVVPRLGRLICGRQGPYDYLAVSIDTWPAPETFTASLHDAGFVGISVRRFLAGVTVLHTARRPVVADISAGGREAAPATPSGHAGGSPPG